MSTRFRTVFLLPVIGLLLVGCSVTYTFDYSSGTPLNPDPATGESRPVRVTVFLLKEDRHFLDATDEDLWKGGNDDVKKDLVGDPHEVDIAPGMTKKQFIWLGDKGSVPDDAKYFAIFAQYVASDPPPKRRGVFTRKDFERATFHFEGTGIVKGVKEDN